MKIINLQSRFVDDSGKINTQVYLSWQVIESSSTAFVASHVQISLTQDFEEMVYDCGIQTDSNFEDYLLKAEIDPGRTYYWMVTVWGNEGDAATSEICSFCS